MSHEVFISYSTKDQTVADAVCQSLEHHGVRCWIASRDIIPGQNYSAEIVEAVTTAKVFVLIFSSNANSSADVARELELAANKLILIQFRIEDVAPAKNIVYWLRLPQWINAYTKPFEPHLITLANSVRRSLGREPIRTEQTPVAPAVSVANATAPAAPPAADSSRFSQRLALVSAAGTLLLAGLVVVLVMMTGNSTSSLDEKPPAQAKPTIDPEFELARAAINDADRELDGWREPAQNQYDAAQLAAQIKALRENRRKVSALLQGNAPAKRLRLDDEVTRLMEGYDTAIERLERLQQSVSLRARLVDLDAAIGDPTRFAEKLDEFVKKYPQAEAATNLAAVAREKPLWQSVLDWNALLARKQFADRAPTPDDASDFISDGEKIRSSAAISPLVDEFLSRRDNYLSAIANRVDFAKKPITGRLKTDLSDHLMRDLYVVELKNGRRYYTNSLEQITERPDGKVQLQYIFNSRLDSKPAQIEEQQIRFKGRAPHCDLAVEVQTLLQDDPQLLAGGWEPTFCKILRRIAEFDAADPVPREMMFRSAHKVAARGSREIDAAFQRQADKVNNHEMKSGVAWFDPLNDEADGERAKAAEFFRTLPSVSAAAEEALASVAKRGQGERTNFVWVGWLRHDGDRGWTLAGSHSPSDASKLFVVANTVGQQPAMHEIGDFSGGKPRWRASDALREGRPVFIRGR